MRPVDACASKRDARTSSLEGWNGRRMKREKEREIGGETVIFGYLFQLTGPDINSRVAMTVYQNSLSLSRMVVYTEEEWTIDTKQRGGRGSPGGSRYVFSEATRSSTPSSEKFCLHPLPFIGDIYRLILLFHSSKFKHSKYPSLLRSRGHKPR